MATKPLQSTEWAVEDVANGINSTDNKAATTVPHRRFGWAFPEPPGRSHYNYWQNAVHLWKEYFDTTLDEGGLLTQNFNIVTEESNYATRTIVINIGTALGARDAAQDFKQSVKTTLVISPSVTTYVAINSSTGTVSEQATLTPTGLGNSNIPLYRVTTNSTDITQVVDLRTPASTALGDIEVLDDRVVILESEMDTAQDDIITAQSTADDAEADAATADGKAVAAQSTANGAVSVNNTQNGRLDDLESDVAANTSDIGNIEPLPTATNGTDWTIARMTLSGVLAYAGNPELDVPNVTEGPYEFNSTPVVMAEFGVIAGGTYYVQLGSWTGSIGGGSNDHYVRLKRNGATQLTLTHNGATGSNQTTTGSFTASPGDTVTIEVWAQVTLSSWTSLPYATIKSGVPVPKFVSANEQFIYTP